jgi:hypothetical protein
MSSLEMKEYETTAFKKALVCLSSLSFDKGEGR